MTPKLPISREAFASAIDRLIERAAKIVAKYPRKRVRKAAQRALAKTA